MVQYARLFVLCVYLVTVAMCSSRVKVFCLFSSSVAILILRLSWISSWCSLSLRVMKYPCFTDVVGTILV